MNEHGTHRRRRLNQGPNEGPRLGVALDFVCSRFLAFDKQRERIKREAGIARSSVAADKDTVSSRDL